MKSKLLTAFAALALLLVAAGEASAQRRTPVRTLLLGAPRVSVLVNTPEVLVSVNGFRRHGVRRSQVLVDAFGNTVAVDPFGRPVFIGRQVLVPQGFGTFNSFEFRSFGGHACW